jgi:rhamnose transport system substrate-binding protein
MLNKLTKVVSVLVILTMLIPAVAMAAPPPQDDQTVVDIAVADGRFTTLVTALQEAGLVETLSGEGPFTVFAPTDDAFNKLPDGTIEGLLADIPALTDVLTYHVVPGKVMAADVVNLTSADTVMGEPLSISVDGETVMINDSTVIIPDIEASNGVIHVIDTVLLPSAGAEMMEDAEMAEEEMMAPAITCEEDYSVQADDWLSKLADKFYGDPLAYPAIFEATNAAVEADSSYSTIANADLIEVGWKLCIPSVEDAQALLGGEMMAGEEAMAEEGAMMGEGRTYVLVPKNLGNPYFDSGNLGAQEAAAELGVTVVYQGSSTPDATEQIQLLNSLIAQQVDGLAVSANDADALVPTGQAAMEAGIPVVSWDAAIGPGGRVLHVNQATFEGIGRGQVQLGAELAGGEGQIAILSATSTAPNQNEWIKWMEEELSLPEYEGIELVATVYGDDEDEKSYNEALGLMKTYPDLKVIVSPTSVGIAAAGRAVQDADKVGEVLVTGLGLPNQLREYVKSGAIPAFQLWNVVDLGYLTIYALDAVATGQIEGNPGDTFEAGRLGTYTVGEEGEVLLGPPFTFDASNIDDFDF